MNSSSSTAVIMSARTGSRSIEDGPSAGEKEQRRRSFPMQQVMEQRRTSLLGPSRSGSHMSSSTLDPFSSSYSAKSRPASWTLSQGSASSSTRRGSDGSCLASSGEISSSCLLPGGYQVIRSSSSNASQQAAPRTTSAPQQQPLFLSPLSLPRRLSSQLATTANSSSGSLGSDSNSHNSGSSPNMLTSSHQHRPASIKRTASSTSSSSAMAAAALLSLIAANVSSTVHSPKTAAAADKGKSSDYSFLLTTSDPPVAAENQDSDYYHRHRQYDAYDSDGSLCSNDDDVPSGTQSLAHKIGKRPPLTSQFESSSDLSFVCRGSPSGRSTSSSMVSLGLVEQQRDLSPSSPGKASNGGMKWKLGVGSKPLPFDLRPLGTASSPASFSGMLARRRQMRKATVTAAAATPSTGKVSPRLPPPPPGSAMANIPLVDPLGSRYRAKSLRKIRREWRNGLGSGSTSGEGAYSAVLAGSSGCRSTSALNGDNEDDSSDGLSAEEADDDDDEARFRTARFDRESGAWQSAATSVPAAVVVTQEKEDDDTVRLSGATKRASRLRPKQPYAKQGQQGRPSSPLQQAQLQLQQAVSRKASHCSIEQRVEESPLDDWTNTFSSIVDLQQQQLSASHSQGSAPAMLTIGTFGSSSGGNGSGSGNRLSRQPSSTGSNLGATPSLRSTSHSDSQPTSTLSSPRTPTMNVVSMITDTTPPSNHFMSHAQQQQNLDSIAMARKNSGTTQLTTSSLLSRRANHKQRNRALSAAADLVHSQTQAQAQTQPMADLNSLGLGLTFGSAIGMGFASEVLAAQAREEEEGESPGAAATWQDPSLSPTSYLPSQAPAATRTRARQQLLQQQQSSSAVVSGSSTLSASPSSSAPQRKKKLRLPDKADWRKSFQQLQLPLAKRKASTSASAPATSALSS